MSEKLTWGSLLNKDANRRKEMRAPVLVVVVVAIHAFAIGSVMFIQGCGTARPPATASVTPPPPPVMPPRAVGPAAPSKPVFHPPVPVEAAP